MPPTVREGKHTHTISHLILVLYLASISDTHCLFCIHLTNNSIKTTTYCNLLVQLPWRRAMFGKESNFFVLFCNIPEVRGTTGEPGTGFPLEKETKEKKTWKEKITEDRNFASIGPPVWGSDNHAHNVGGDERGRDPRPRDFPCCIALDPSPAGVDSACATNYLLS